MLKWYIAVVIGLGSPMLATLSPEMEAAQTNTCDSNSKVANLDFVLKDMNGRDVMLSAYKGKVILLDFWATWCAPCRIEIPGFVELYNKYRSRDFVVLGVSMDDTTSPVKPFAQKLKMNYPVLIGTGREDIKQAFELTGLPTSFVISRDGKICGQHTGFAPKEQFERQIKALL